MEMLQKQSQALASLCYCIHLLHLLLDPLSMGGRHSGQQ